MADGGTVQYRTGFRRFCHDAVKQRERKAERACAYIFNISMAGRYRAGNVWG